ALEVELLAGCPLPGRVRMLRAEDRADSEEAVVAELRSDDVAELRASRVSRVVVHHVTVRAVVAVLLAAPGLRAELLHLPRIADGDPRDVAAHRLEAVLRPARIALAAPVRGLRPAAVHQREDVRGDEQVAVELVRAIHVLAVAREEQV